MRWETISASTSNEVYQLLQNDKRLLTLTLHPFSKTARLDCETEKRVFQIRKEGFLRNRTVLRNEYGVKIGELGQENKELFIEVNNERFYYTINNNSTPELNIYKDDRNQPLIVCELTNKNSGPEVKLNDVNPSDLFHSSLLMAMCWYLFMPVLADKRLAVG